MVQAAVADPTPVEGQLIRGPWTDEIISRTCEGDLAAGRLLEWGTDPATQVMEMAAIPVADADAIMTAAVFVTSAGLVDYLPAVFNGVIGFDRIAPARNVTITFDAHADWNVATGLIIQVFGHDAYGAPIAEEHVKLTGSGAYTWTSLQAFSSVTTVRRGICAGAGGTGTVGVSSARMELSQNEYPGIAVYEAAKEPNTAARNYADEEPVSILTHGRFIAVPEHAVTAGDDVYVRVLTAGADLVGQFTGMDGAVTPGTYAKLLGAKWLTPSAADGLATIELAGV